MPRYNSNADFHRFNHQFNGRILPEDRIVFLDRQPKTQGASRIKTTGESIVREFKQQERERPEPTFQPYRVIPQPRPSIIRRIINRINWGIVFDLTCASLAAIAITYIFGFIIFGPFKIK